MSDHSLPVTVGVTRPDGSVEQVQVGTAQKQGEGFRVQLFELTIGAVPGARARPSPAPGAAVFPNYGRSKGMPIAGASLSDLEFYANGCRRTLADPSKARWHEKERALLAAIEAEIARQRGASGDPPPPADDEVPF